LLAAEFNPLVWLPDPIPAGLLEKSEAPDDEFPALPELPALADGAASMLRSLLIATVTPVSLAERVPKAVGRG
jgi:hypothetical protein